MEGGRSLRAASCVCDGLSCYMEQPAAFGGFWKQSSGEPGGLRDYGSSLLEFGSFGRPAAFRNTGFRYSRLPLYPAVADSRLSLFPPSEDSLLFHNPAILYPQGSNHSLFILKITAVRQKAVGMRDTLLLLLIPLAFPVTSFAVLFAPLFTNPAHSLESSHRTDAIPFAFHILHYTRFFRSMQRGGGSSMLSIQRYRQFQHAIQPAKTTARPVSGPLKS